MERVHLRTVVGDLDAQEFVEDAARLEIGGNFLELLRVAGERDGAKAVDRRDGNAGRVREQSLRLGLGQPDREHRALPSH